MRVEFSKSSHIASSKPTGLVQQNPVENTSSASSTSAPKPTAHAAATPYLVTRGDTVYVIARTAFAEITTTAEARADGRLGDLIEVETWILASVSSAASCQPALWRWTLVVNRRNVRGAIAVVAAVLFGLACVCSAQSLYSADGAMGTSLFADVKARDVGDIVTIVVRERKGKQLDIQDYGQECGSRARRWNRAPFFHPLSWIWRRVWQQRIREALSDGNAHRNYHCPHS